MPRPISKKSKSEFARELHEKIGKDFLTIKVKIGDEIFKADVLEELLDFDPNDPLLLQKAFASQPAQSAKYGVVLAKAKRRLAALEQEEKAWRREKRGKMNMVLSKKWKAEKIRKSPTKEDVDAEIDNKYHDEAERFVKLIGKWTETVDILDVLYKSWRERKDMLVSQGHILNRFIDNDVIEIPKIRQALRDT